MVVTKYEHACLDITSSGTRIVIDPGEFSSSFGDTDNIHGLVITHAHSDHFSPKLCQQIINHNPDIQIFTTKDVAEKLKLPATIVQPDASAKIGDLELKFYGQKHAVIDPQTPVIDNFGVLVNNNVYYPGDSFTKCPEEFMALAVPASAPWLKVSDVEPLVSGSQCQTVFPTHNALLSDIGHQITNSWLQKFTERSSKQFIALESGQSITL